jgi:hypothetical protein
MAGRVGHDADAAIVSEAAESTLALRIRPAITSSLELPWWRWRAVCRPLPHLEVFARLRRAPRFALFNHVDGGIRSGRLYVFQARFLVTLLAGHQIGVVQRQPESA